VLCVDDDSPPAVTDDDLGMARYALHAWIEYWEGVADTVGEAPHLPKMRIALRNLKALGVWQNAHLPRTPILLPVIDPPEHPDSMTPEFKRLIVDASMDLKREREDAFMGFRRALVAVPTQSDAASLLSGIARG